MRFAKLLRAPPVAASEEGILKKIHFFGRLLKSSFLDAIFSREFIMRTKLHLINNIALKSKR